MNMVDKLVEGTKTALIDSDIDSSLEYRPEFLSNDHQQGQKILAAIEKELLACDQFYVSVAFITNRGLEVLIGAGRAPSKRHPWRYPDNGLPVLYRASRFEEDHEPS